MVVSTFEWLLIGLVLVGIVPAWLIGIAAFSSAKGPRREEPSSRYFAYDRLLQTIYPKSENGNFSIPNGAAYAACLRELRNYPEYADLSLLLLEEINITGSRKFDDVMRAELKAIESVLLDLRRK